jgi:hypothetical protein
VPQIAVLHSLAGQAKLMIAIVAKDGSRGLGLLLQHHHLRRDKTALTLNADPLMMTLIGKTLIFLTILWSRTISQVLVTRVMDTSLTAKDGTDCTSKCQLV